MAGIIKKAENFEIAHHNRWYRYNQPNKYMLIFACLFSGFMTKAQTMDSLKTEKQTMPEDQFPSKRPVQIRYDDFAKRNFTSQLCDKQLQQGKVEADKRITMNATIPVYIQARYIVTASVRYSNEDIKLSYVSFTTPGNTNCQQSVHRTFEYFSTTANVIYFSSLFKRPVIYITSIITDGDQNGLKRVYGKEVAILQLKTSKNISISVGLIGFIDPAFFFPVVPCLAVQLVSQNSAWRFDLSLPQHIQLKRSLFHHAQVSLGSELNSNVFYVKSSVLVQPGTYQFSQLEVKTGTKYEQKINEQFIFSINVGYQNIFNANLSPKSKPNSDYVYQTKSDGTGYFNMGFSYIPFKKKLARSKSF